MIASTPEPPYWAVIFTSERTEVAEGYEQTAGEMEALAAQQAGYLGIESADGITVSYWRSLEDIAAWRRQADHLAAQRAGREKWYRRYALRVARVERASAFTAETASTPAASRS